MLRLPPTAPGRRLGALWAACVLLGSTGCVTFEKETMVFVFPPDSKEVRGLLVYEGVRVTTDNATDLAKAQEQLTRFVNGGQEFCLGDNWILHFDLAPETGDDPAARALKAMLRKHLVVRNGTFFLDKDGKLCGYQTVTVRDRDRFAADLNAQTSAGMADFATRALADPKTRGSWWDDESLRLVQQAARKQFAWFRLEPGRVSFTLPAAPAAVRRLKREALNVEEIARLRNELMAPGKPAGPPPDVRQRVDPFLANLENVAAFLGDTPLSFDQRADRCTIALGLGGGRPIRLTVPGAPVEAQRKVDEELLAHARTLKAPFKAGLTAEGLIAAFLKGGPPDKKP
jgi:hypothetical protein